MSTLLYLLLHALKAINSPDDCFRVAMLLGIDSIFWVGMVRLWAHLRRW